MDHRDLAPYEVVVEGIVRHRLSLKRKDGCSLGCPGVPMASVSGIMEGADVLLCGPHIAYWKDVVGDLGEFNYFFKGRGWGSGGRT